MSTLTVLNQNIFREYDIRGRVDIDFDAKAVYRIVRCFAEHVKKMGGQKIVVGYDGRHSSPLFEAAAMHAIDSLGLDSVRLGLCATPVVYYGAKHVDANGSIMITGSHNPADFNGLKFTCMGSPFYGVDIQNLKHDVLKDGSDIPHNFSSSRPCENFKEAYVKHIVSDYHAHYPQNKLKIVWDMGNGATGPFVEAALKDFGGDHILLNKEVDGSFPAHHPDPVVAKNLAELIQAVHHHNADFGIAFDGDGDRLGVVDERGDIRWGDQLLMLFAMEALKQQPGCDIIADVKASQQLFNYIEHLGGVPHLSPCGHSIIKKKMIEMNCMLAGEMSGHMFFGDRNFGYDDAIYAAFRLLGIANQLSVSLGSWFSQFPKTYTTPEIRVNCDHINKFSVVDAVRDHLHRHQEKFNDIDGIRLESEEGWWLLRASNTQEELVVRIEGKTTTSLQRLSEKLEVLLNKHGLSFIENIKAQ